MNLLFKGLTRHWSKVCIMSLMLYGISNQTCISDNGKDCKIKDYDNQFAYGYKMIPHPKKVDKGGEDAYFVHQQLIAVADGVGGWGDVGIDPAFYSRGLCSNVGKYWRQNPEKYRKKPKLIITDAHSQVVEEGSSTLVVCTIDDKKPKLYCSYIGDSGYMIFRHENGKLVCKHEFEEQQKSFNFPYQLGYDKNGDDPSHSLEFEHDIQDNDILVVGSDGLFDNMDAQQISSIIFPFMPYSATDISFDVQTIAEAMAQRAFALSVDKHYNSPFAKRAKKSRLNYKGGKSDDITVVVAQIKLKIQQGVKTNS